MADCFDKSAGVGDYKVLRTGQREVNIGLVLRAVAVRFRRPDVATLDFCAVSLLMFSPLECHCSSPRLCLITDRCIMVTRIVPLVGISIN